MSDPEIAKKEKGTVEEAFRRDPRSEHASQKGIGGKRVVAEITAPSLEIGPRSPARKSPDAVEGEAPPSEGKGLL
jgi:hypothetical protein